MLYLLDANVLIDANRDYYPLDRVPEFWDWLVDCGTTQHVKIPLEMYEEVLAGKEDDLTRWLKDNREALLLDEDVNETLVARVTDSGYARDRTLRLQFTRNRTIETIARSVSTWVTTTASKPPAYRRIAPSTRP